MLRIFNCEIDTYDQKQINHQIINIQVLSIF